MPDDLKNSQLISRSLRIRLDSDQQTQIDQHLNESEESRKFAELSHLIQQSVAGESAVKTKSISGGNTSLTAEAKKRLSESVTKAISEKASLSQAGLVAPLDSAGATRAIEFNESVFGSGGEESAHHRQLISRFKLIRRLGQGGLGNVWLARDEKLNRNVAIKELRDEALESPRAWQRFHREAEITGHLEHPNVVPLYQFGVDRNSGEPFYAMRFVGKRTLADAIIEYHDRVEAGESRALGLHRLLAAFLDICQAIAYAHSRGIIHRDLKPENVALDTFCQVIVLDWGLAKVMEDSELANKMSTESMTADSAILNQTMEGDVVGTPLYMSPEQAAGELEMIDAKTDVYGLGAILFAILTGDAPHARSASGGSDSVKEILKTIANSETPRACAYGKCVASELEAICHKAMARKRHLRYDSVQELANAVERWMAGQSEKKSGYDNLRMEGRELRADLQSSVQNLERNVRFAAELPPIEQLMHVESDEEVSIWRERLASIFQGLLRANPDYQSIVYSKVNGDGFTEIVRVERHGIDASNIRTIPRTRLRSETTNEYISSLSQMKPQEVLTSLVCDPLCERQVGCNDTVGLLSGVPVYDNRTEDVFGIVMINCDMDRVLRRQMNRRMSASEIVVACDVFHTMMHVKSGHVSEDSLSRKVADVAPHYLPAVDALQNQLEFIDDANSDVYGARLWFTPDKHGIMYLLKRKEV